MNTRNIILYLQAVVCILLAVLLAASSVVVFLDGSARKSENPLESIFTPENAGEILMRILPLFLVFLLLLIVSWICGIRPGTGGSAGTAAVKPQPAPKMKHERMVRTVLVVAAVGLILAGILNGSAMDVLLKAITICSECIGLG